MNKNIKYIIEKIQKFNPIEYQDENNNLIDSEIITELTDPISIFINFLSSYKWKEYTFGVYIKGNINNVWLSILNKIDKILNEYSKMDLDETSYNYTADIIYDPCETQDMIMHQLVIINNIDNKGIVFSHIVDKENNIETISIGFKNLFYKKEKLVYKPNSLTNMGTIPAKLIEKIKILYNLKEDE